MNVHAILTDSAYAQLKRYILNQTGLSYYEDKDEDLAARIGRRFAHHNCTSYLHLLQTSEKELEALIGELTIGETYFFRQSEHFQLIREQIIPDLLERNRHSRRLRIWSAGCATGAEPYSISLLLEREFARELRYWEVSILGTDINVEFLEKARTATFPNWTLRETTPEIKECCFEQTSRGWILQPKYQKHVTFEYHNLVSHSLYPGADGNPFDLILCRNVMIYFSRPQIMEVVKRLHESMADGGWLLVGHAEPHGETFQHFELMSNAKVTAYRRASSNEATPPLPFVEWTPHIFEDHPLSQPPAPDITPLLDQTEQSAPHLNTETCLAVVRDLADQGNWSRAAEVCQELLAESALNAPAHLLMGLVLSQTASPEEAQAAFRRAIYLERGFVFAHYQLAVSLQSMAKKQQAKKSFENVLQLTQHKAKEEPLPYGDGITIEELQELTRMHLEALNKE
jgi:chemotaxis protein methyltransferase CheR